MQEYRRIVFAPPDVIKAIDYCRRRNRIPGIGDRIQRLCFEDHDGRVSATVHLSGDGLPSPSLVVDATELLAALISYCLYTRVPIPKIGERRVALIGGEPALVITGIRPHARVES